MEFDKKHSLSLKQKIKLFVCATCCDAEEDDIAVQKSLEHSEKKPNTLSSWLKSELPVIKEVCSHVFSGKNRRSNSTEFRYDPLSYALNFEDDDSYLDEFPLRDFSSRLPPSPVKANKNAVVSTHTVNWS